MIQHVTRPTRIQPGQCSNVLDLVFTNTEEEVSHIIYLEPLGSSDHLLLRFDWRKPHQLYQRFHPRRNVWRADLDGMTRQASNLDWNISPTEELEAMWSFIKTRICGLVNDFAPLSKKRHPQKGPPWIDSEVLTLLKRRKRLWDHFKATLQPDDYARYKECRNQCTEFKRQKRRAYEERLVKSSVNAPKILFSYLKRRTKRGTGIPPLQCGDVFAEEDAEKARVLREQYASVFTQEKQPMNKQQQSTGNVHHT
jgi:hypothetical protein